MPEEDVQAAPPPRRRRPLAANLISEIAVALAFIALANIVFLVYMDVTAARENPYIGVLGYMVLPVLLFGAIVLFVVGVLLERRRRRNLVPDQIPPYPDFDMNDPRMRRLVIGAVAGIVLFVVVSLLGSYRAYHYTDSDQFCGTLCHQVMNPEYTAYKASPHARVGCVGCHVGEGATWYVKSKLSGAYQVYSTALNKYPRPIPSPVKNLRPSRETCEQCHWPEKFFGAQLKVFSHFGYDEGNTPREIRMLIKTGGGSPTGGVVAGIHWHMFNEHQIQYLASDERRQKIDWVRSTNRRTGEVHEYKAQDSKLTDAQIAAAPKRVMDCVDCHNRPTHIYVPPDRAIDRELIAGHIDRTLPFVKAQAVEFLSADYKTTDEALKAIDRGLRGFYSTKYPDVSNKKRAAVEDAIKATQQVLQNTRFPEMNVDWRTHPDNIGHFYFAGCFRCHDNQHVLKTNPAKSISKDCHICHDVLGEAQGGAPMFEMPKNEFQHPVDLGDMTAVTCADCHTGKSM